MQSGLMFVLFLRMSQLDCRLIHLNIMMIVYDDLLQDDVVQVYLCGASLITPQVVLTSAHCVNDTNALRVRNYMNCASRVEKFN